MTPAELVIYRMENPETNHGMWYRGDGQFDPFIKKLTEGISADLPMEWHRRYGAEGFRWFSGCTSVADMNRWFSPRDAAELQYNGYQLFKFTSRKFVHEEHQVLFTREGIIHREAIPLGEVWEGLSTINLTTHGATYAD